MHRCSSFLFTELEKCYTWPKTVPSFCSDDRKRGIHWFFYAKNSFLFKHNLVTSVAAQVYCESIFANLITLNFWNGNFLGDCRSIFTTTAKINHDEKIGTTRNEYQDGFKIFSFNLRPALCVDVHQEFKRSGIYRCHLKLGKHSKINDHTTAHNHTSVTVILYVVYNDLISVSITRKVLKDY